MKIAFVSDSIYPYNKGGKETRSYELAKNLSKKGHEVHFYTMKFWEGKDVIKKDGFYLHGIGKARPLYKGKTRSIKQAILFGFSAFKLLGEDYDIIDADHMVYFHLFPLKLASMLKGKPLYITWHEVWGKEYWVKYMGKKGILGHLVEKLSSKLPHKIIAVSENTKRQLIERLKVNPKKIEYIPNWINNEEISKIKPSKNKEDTSDVIFVGRLLSHKNVNVLIQAISIIKKTNPKIKCMIVGDGPEMVSLKELTSKLNLNNNITFKGFTDSHNEVISLIKSSKVFVLPSTREGFGITVIEAFACGVPVITTNHEDNASKDLILQGKNGYVCNLNESDVARNIIKALNQYKTMKQECLNTAKQYDWKNIISKFEGVYG